VKMNDVLLSLFEMKVGVRTEDTLSAFLFNIFINEIVQKVIEDGYRGDVGDFQIPVMAFSDDMALMADGKEW
jgi:hypothetical protein